MSREAQGLIKYECIKCEKEFLAGFVDNLGGRPVCCPWCGDARIDWVAYSNRDTPPDWLDEMG